MMGEPLKWARLNVGWRRHPKVLELEALGSPGKTAILDWLTLIGFAVENMTDGYVSVLAYQRLGISPGSIRMLVRVRLLDEELDGLKPGYRLHNFDMYQPTRDTITQRREQASAAAQI